MDIRRDQVNISVILWSVASMERSSSYVAISKGRGFLYASENQLYKQVRRRGSVIYLKCQTDPCDGSAKIDKKSELMLMRRATASV